MDDRDRRALDQVNRPAYQPNFAGDGADRQEGQTFNRPSPVRNRDEAIFSNINFVTLAVLGALVVVLLSFELVGLMTGDDYVKELFFTPMRLITEMELVKLATKLFNGVKYLKEAHEIFNWLRDRISLLLEWFNSAF